MPRPKSELTARQKQIGVRLTVWQFEEWKRLGASKWIKQLLTESYKKRVKHD